MLTHLLGKIQIISQDSTSIITYLQEYVKMNVFVVLKKSLTSALEVVRILNKEIQTLSTASDLVTVQEMWSAQ